MSFMRDSPFSVLAGMPWRISLPAGLGLLAFGFLLKTEELSAGSPAKFALGQAVQFISLVFMLSALVSLARAFSIRFLSRSVAPAEIPAPKPASGPAFAPAPKPEKKKYTEMDFMPPEMRAALEVEKNPAQTPSGGATENRGNMNEKTI